MKSEAAVRKRDEGLRERKYEAAVRKRYEGLREKEVRDFK